MLDNYPKFKRGEIKTIRENFPAKTKQFLKDYFEYREATGLKDLSNLTRYVCHVRHIIEKPFEEFSDYKEHVRLINIIKKSSLSEGVKFNILVDLNNLFEYVFPVMWKRENKFKELYCGKKGKKGPIFVKPAFDESKLPTDEEIDKMLQAENDLSWKCFLLIASSTGARQTEIRHTENSLITFDEDGTSRIEMNMSKNDKKKIVFLDATTTSYVKRLQEKLKKQDRLGKYLFPSKYKSMNGEPISRANVCDRIKELSKKATGRELTIHKFRHLKSTYLYGLVKNNKISESTALSLLGHGKSMMSTYDHTPKDEEIAILKEQAFNPEITEDERNILQKRIDDQQEQLTKLSDTTNQRNSELLIMSLTNSALANYAVGQTSKEQLKLQMKAIKKKADQLGIDNYV